MNSGYIFTEICSPHLLFHFSRCIQNEYLWVYWLIGIIQKCIKIYWVDFSCKNFFSHLTYLISPPFSNFMVFRYIFRLVDLVMWFSRDFHWRIRYLLEKSYLTSQTVLWSNIHFTHFQLIFLCCYLETRWIHFIDFEILNFQKIKKRI